MPDYPAAAVIAAAEAINWRQRESRDHDPDELARAALDAVAPLLAEAVAAKILAHAARRPKVLHGTLGAWHRHFGIAARVAAGAFATDAEKRQQAAEALAAGDFIACGIPEDPGA